MNREFMDKIERSPVIAAVKDEEGLKKALSSEIEVVFILYGDVCTLPDIVARVKQSGRVCMVHLDLIGGLSLREPAVDYVRQKTQADGILTTRTSLVSYAKSLGLHAILRCFILDSMSLGTLEKVSAKGVSQPDYIEILPGVLEKKVIRKLNEISRVPIICGGLISDKDDVIRALEAGATAISTTRQEIWFM